jgi:hypothetical protein
MAHQPLVILQFLEEFNGHIIEYPLKKNLMPDFQFKISEHIR